MTVSLQMDTYEEDILYLHVNLIINRDSATLYEGCPSKLWSGLSV